MSEDRLPFAPTNDQMRLLGERRAQVPSMLEGGLNLPVGCRMRYRTDGTPMTGTDVWHALLAFSRVREWDLTVGHRTFHVVETTPRSMSSDG